MGFLDDLDSAFDSLLSQPKEEPETDPAPPDFFVDQGTDMLKMEIADMHAVGVKAIFGLLDQLPRIPVLTALHGSLVYLSLIEPRSQRNQDIRDMIQSLETQKGSIRRRLTHAQLEELTQRQAQLPAVGNGEQEQARALLTALTHQRAIPAREYHALYKAGIWQAVQFTQGSPDQLAHLSGLPQERISLLKAAVTLS